MGFYLGDYWINEILQAAILPMNTNKLIGVLFELQTATIELTAENNEITDKKGNLVKRKYRTKTGTFNSTNTFLNTLAQNLGSGSEIDYLSETNAKTMKLMEVVAAGSKVKLNNYVAGTAVVQGMFKGNASGPNLKLGTSASYDDLTFAISGDELIVPAAAADAPIKYVVVYDTTADSGLAMYNNAEKFPDVVRMVLKCEYETACDGPDICYVYIHRFQPSPETTISLDSETQTMDFNGDILTDICGTEKLLYTIYFPGKGAEVTPGGDLTATVTAVDSSKSLFGTPVTDIQSNVVVGDSAITGTLKYLESGEIVRTWGAGNFMAIQLADIPATATSVKVGMDPSQGSGLVEIIDDPDLNGVFKVSDKDTQVFVVEITDGTNTNRKTYSLSGLTVLSE